jgi:hypothetical protein
MPIPDLRNCRVLPWEAMSPQQQAEHLVHGHRLDHDYWGPDKPELTGDADVVAWYRDEHTTKERREEHTDDHAEDAVGNIELPPHRHTKGVTAPTRPERTAS